MRTVDRKIVLSCARQMLRALVRFCLRHALTSGEIEMLLRKEFVDCVKENLDRDGETASLSRISVATGLSRRQIQQVLDRPADDRGAPSLLMKVIGQWQNDRKFTDEDQRPRILTFGGVKSEFNQLVAKISTDLNPAAVLFELERSKAVERTADGVKLAVEFFKPRGDVDTGFRVLGQDMRDLVTVVEENVLMTPAIGNLHLRTEYDRIRPEGMLELKKWLLSEGNAFHERARKKISEFDQDVNPDPDFKESGVRVVLNSFGKVFEAEG